MPILHALILGIVQGLTEFIPISSSGHLIIFPELFGWQTDALVFDTTLHLGTVMVLIVYFWKDLWRMYKALVTEVFSSKVANKLNLRSYSKDARLGILVLLGSVPAGLAGALFNDFFDATFRSVFSVALFALAGTIFMIAAEVIYKKIYQKLPLEKLTTKKSLFVGICQILPLCPGFSRSGATISAGMLAGLSREDSAKFSFLLSIPVILGAGFLGLLKSHSEVHVIGYGAFAVGFSASFLVGLVAVSFLMKFLKSNNLYPFIVYRLLLVVGLFIILIK